MTSGPVNLPDDISAAARRAAEDLFEALRPAMTAARPSSQVSAMWQMVKMLNAVSGGLHFGSTPEAERPRARWEEAAELASSIADQALTIAAAGMSAEQAANRLMDTDASDVLNTAAAYAGTIELTPPDAQETDRTLTVAIQGGQRTLSVTADRGPAPTPRPHTAATLLRTAHHLHRLGATLGELVLEPEADGVPLCGRADDEVTCEICQSTISADAGRTADVTSPWHHQVTVCSVTCARAAHAGEHTF